MSELSPEAKALLSNARSGLGPDAAAIARVRAGVAATVAVPPPPPPPASAAAVAKVGAAVSTKLAVVSVIGVVVAATSYVAMKRGPATTVPAPAIRLEVAPERTAPVPQRDPAPAPASREELVLPPERVAPVAPPPVTAPPAPAPAAEPSEPEKPAAEPAASKAHNASKHGPALGRESQLLDAARASFERGDLPRAVTYLDTYEHETHGAGQMAEDAAALEIEIACRRHDAAAQTQLEAFDQRWPTSTYRVRLANACETE